MVFPQHRALSIRDPDVRDLPSDGGCVRRARARVAVWRELSHLSQGGAALGIYGPRIRGLVMRDLPISEFLTSVFCHPLSSIFYPRPIRRAIACRRRATASYRRRRRGYG